MANLAIVGSSHVNGVAGIHTEILRSRVFLPFAQLFPDKFLNITNGVTQVQQWHCSSLARGKTNSPLTHSPFQRRWMVQANKELTALISQVSLSPHQPCKSPKPQTTPQELGGSQWQFDMRMLKQLEAKCSDAELQVSY
jgi:glucan phosphorylase